MPNIPGLEESHVFTDTMSFFTSSPFPGLAIHYTIDGTIPLSSSPILSRPLGIDHSLTMRLASFSPGGNRSAMNIVSFDRQSYAEAVALPNQKPGLECRLYWGNFPRTTKIKDNADSVLRVGEVVVPAGIPDTGFGLKFKGYIEVPETGVYRFYLTCDDGGLLNIADRLIVDNDGDHGPREKSGEVALKKGVHPFALNFTNLSYGYTLSLKYSKDNGPRQNIPASWYKSGL
jgi:hexosaminidase